MSRNVLAAAKLVVDTGIHSLGWDWEKAKKYFLDNTPFPEHVIQVS